MTCANCEALREHLRRAERELGLRRRDGVIGALMHRMGLEPVQAVVVLDMYEGGGRCVSQERLMANSGTPNRNTLQTQVCRIRKRLGDSVIETYDSTGYGLSAGGMSRVMAAIEPPVLQDVRGGVVVEDLV